MTDFGFRWRKSSLDLESAGYALVSAGNALRVLAAHHHPDSQTLAWFDEAETKFRTAVSAHRELDADERADLREGLAAAIAKLDEMGVPK